MTDAPDRPRATTATTDERPDGRGPLRLALSERPGRDALDGGWWPWSRDLPTELADLAEHFPATWGRIMCVLCSPPDWDSTPRCVSVAGDDVAVAASPGDDTHVVVLRLLDESELRLLVVPPALSQADGQEAMLAASTSGNAHDAASLLRTISDSPVVDPDGYWAPSPA